MENTIGFRKAEVQGSNISGTLTNKVYWIDLSKLGITNLDEAQSVRVYTSQNKTTELARAVLSAKVVYVKFASIATGSDVWVDWDGIRGDYSHNHTYGRNATFSQLDGYYPLNENSGTTAVNLVGGDDGTYHGDLPNRTASGIQYGQDFADGSGDYVSGIVDANFSTRYTLRCVVYIDDISQISNKDTILGFKDSYECELRFRENINVRRFQFQQHNGSNIISTESAPLSDNTMYVVHCAWFGPGFYLYVDGSLAGEAVVNGIRSLSNSDVNIIGGEGTASSPGRLLDGVIVSDVLIETGRVWSTAEIAADSRNLHDNASSGDSLFWGAWGTSKQIDVVSHGTLKNELVSWWDLKEESGTRYDSHGSNNLTDYNTVGSATGPRGLYADFNKDNSETLYIPVNADGMLFTNNQDISVSGWFKFDPTTGAVILMSCRDRVADEHGFTIVYANQNSSGSRNLQCTLMGGVITSASFANDLSADKLYFYVVTVDVSSGTGKFLVKDTEGNTLLNSTKTNSNITGLFPHSNNTFLAFNAVPTTSGFLTYTSGNAQSVGIWNNKLLSDSEKDYLYNGGSPLFYDNYAKEGNNDALLGSMMAQAGGII